MPENRAPAFGSARRPLTTIEILLGAVVVVVAAFSAVGIVLAEIGKFRADVLLPAGVLSSAIGLAAARWSARKSGATIDRSPLRDWAAVGVLVAAGFWLFRPPADTLIEGSDASVYLGISGMIASTGGLRVNDPVLRYLPPETRSELFSLDQTRPARLNYLSGGVQLGPDGAVEPNFFHLTPVWMAMFEVLGGGRAALDVNPVFGIIALALTWAVTRRLAGSMAALIAAAALALNFGEIWFARLPSSEMLTQACALAAVFLLLVVTDGGPAVAGVLGGAAVGLVSFARLDALLVVAVPLLMLSADRAVAGAATRRGWISFFLVGTLATAYAYVHSLWFSGAYTPRVLNMEFRWRHDQIVPQMPLIVGAVLVGLLGGWLLIPSRYRRIGVRAAILLGVGAAALFVIAGGWWFNESPFFLLVPRVVALVAIAGLLAALIQAPDRARPMGLAFLVSGLAFLVDPHDVELMPLMLRRFVPLLLPLVFVFVAYALSIGRTRWWGRAIGAIAALAIVAVSAQQISVLWGLDGYRDLRSELEQLAAAIPAKALTFVDRRAPTHLGLALKYTLGRDSLEITGPARGDTLERVSSAALGEGRRVFVVIPHDFTPGRSGRLDFGPLVLEPVNEFSMHYQTLDSPNLGRLPRMAHAVTDAMGLYEVVDASPGPLPKLLDVGRLDYGSLVSGFYGPETIKDSSARWTDGNARVRVPPLAVPAGSPLTLSFRVAVPAPGAVPLPTIEVSINGSAAGSLALTTGDFAEYHMTLTPERSAELRHGATITIHSPTFVPSAFDAGGDSRRLGVVIDWLAFGL